MKSRIPEPYYPLIAAIPGGIGLLLRLALYGFAEPSGLLPSGHPLYIATIILSIATAILALFQARHADSSATFVHGSSRFAATGAFFAGLWLLPVAFEIVENAHSGLEVFLSVMGFLSVPCLIVLAWQFFKGRQPHFLVHTGLCLFFLSYMVCQYPHWCGNPQVEDYLMPLLACLFLNLTAYFRAVFDFQAGGRRKLLFCGWMAGFFCICALAGSGDRRFYLAGALWALTNLHSIQPPVQKEEPYVSA